MKTSLLRWYGGKYYILNKILPFPQHKTYFEIFGGSAVVLLNKIKSTSEIYNDINSRLVNFWKVIRDNWRILKQYTETEIPSRKIFNEYLNKSNDNLEDALRFFYVNRLSFSGNNQTYIGFNIGKPKNGPIAYFNLIKKFELIHERIKHVNFENVSYELLLKRILKNGDLESTLIYCDPPYYNGGTEYENGIGGKEWNNDDFDKLWELLSKFKNAKIIVSIDRKDVLDGWYIQEIERINRNNYTIERKLNRKIEYILRNYDKEKIPLMSKNTIKLERWINENNRY